MKQPRLIKRFIIPLIGVIGFHLISGLLYDLSSTLTPGLLKSSLIGVFGPLTFISLWFFAFVGPVFAYFRGARFWERMMVAFANPIIWIVSVEAKMACQYCLVEMVYFFFLPWTFGIVCVTCVEFAISEIICRWIDSKRLGKNVRIFHPAVSALLVTGAAGLYFGLIKGQEWVYFIVHHFRDHFP